MLTLGGWKDFASRKMTFAMLIVIQNPDCPLFTKEQPGSLKFKHYHHGL